jgi:hypothetical protein
MDLSLLNDREIEHVRVVLVVSAETDRAKALEIARRKEDSAGQKLAIRALLESAAESDRLARLMAR